MKVLVVEAWFGGSHRAWAEGYQRHSVHDVELVTHEPEFWRWRMRGGSVTLSDLIDQHVTRSGRPDVVMVSGLVDLAGLLGQTRRSLGEVPVALYLHESQLTYPRPGNRQPDEATSLINWTSMVAADRVYVNSQHHRDELFTALDGLLARAPDRDHRGHLAAVDAATSVLPVGVELSDVRTGGGAAEAPLVLWSHRWDHDKNPQAFFAALARLDDDGVGFRLAVVGENSLAENTIFDEARERFSEHLVERAEYVDILARADVVVSCARHEFFGVAMVEAMAAGAVPVLPARLSYPELVPSSLHRWCLYPEGALRERLTSVLTDLPLYRDAVAGLAVEMGRFGWDVLAPLYDAELAALAADYGERP